MQNTRQITEFRRCTRNKIIYTKSCFAHMCEVLQSLRNDEVFCDVKLVTEDDNKIIFAHKVVLASACRYFHAMFTKFAERNLDIIVIRDINPTALRLLVDFMYSGRIIITEENVKILLSTSDLLQLEEVTEQCCYYLQDQLCPENCIDIYATADLYSCTILLANSERYIQQYFSEVVAGDDFLSLSAALFIQLISSDKLASSEEKVFESVIRWVKHDSNLRKYALPQLMEYVRLPLTSKKYILDKVVEESLIRNCCKCKSFINEALNFQILKAEKYCSIPQNIRHKPRYGDNVMLVAGETFTGVCKKMKWYDPKTNRWQYGPEIITSREGAGLAVLKDHLVVAVGGFDKDNNEYLRSVTVVDVSSKSLCWKPSVDMIVKRKYPVVGVINDYLYAVGGVNNVDGNLNSAEMFDYNTQEWRMISGLPSKRSRFGGAVLNNLLYVVGGRGISMQNLDTVECYHPGLDKWKPVAKMSVRRSGVGVGVLDGVLYAVGGHDGYNTLNSVEAYRPSTGVWTSIADMYHARKYAGVVALNGLLYVVDGHDDSLYMGLYLGSSECYDPQTNSWTMVTALKHDERIHSRVVAFNRPRHLTTC
ncbi:kelch-like protein 2 [Acyrthosiphon pisum]|uniref:Kelch-like protein diablo n=1 Tax=Acyrthosiphon pisum TaxID=7029 RepID=A0A8R1W0L7_ACYPI|nr:kelch-like protein 2 [Acyrthosiphon pisum]|eukprot:XP_001947287.2 PREDICTED: kelch-like protein 2 [Acyrthosiphon pisum]